MKEDLSRLLAVLEAERAALAANKLESLASLGEEKQALVERLHTQRAALRNAPKEIRDLAVRAEEANRLNGTLIRRRLDAVRLALGTLTGAAQAAPVYGADGLLSPSPVSRFNIQT